VWSLQTYSAIHRLAAHDNSVTSLQFDDSRIVSGGSDGRVKVWDLQRGNLVRELGSPAEAVWRVVFEEEKAVVLASRGGKTVMEVWNFAPPPDEDMCSPSSSYSRSTHSTPAITPYQDPAYGEHPTYEVSTSLRGKHMRAIAQNQDEVMTDVYSSFGTSEDDGAEQAGPALESTDY